MISNWMAFGVPFKRTRLQTQEASQQSATLTSETVSSPESYLLMGIAFCSCCAHCWPTVVKSRAFSPFKFTPPLLRIRMACAHEMQILERKPVCKNCTKKQFDLNVFKLFFHSLAGLCFFSFVWFYSLCCCNTVNCPSVESIIILSSEVTAVLNPPYDQTSARNPSPVLSRGVK